MCHSHSLSYDGMEFLPVLQTLLCDFSGAGKDLQAISLLAPVMGAEITCQKLLPVVINSSKDR
jgi:hypothetical protein